MITLNPLMLLITFISFDYHKNVAKHADGYVVVALSYRFPYYKKSGSQKRDMSRYIQAMEQVMQKYLNGGERSEIKNESRSKS